MNGWWGEKVHGAIELFSGSDLSDVYGGINILLSADNGRWLRVSQLVASS